MRSEEQQIYFPWIAHTPQTVCSPLWSTELWSDDFTHFMLAISFFCLPHLSLNLIPLQSRLHISPMLEDTKSYSWQELLMQIRGGGIEILWWGGPAPPLYYFQSLGSSLPASCSLLEHLNWVSRTKSDFFSTYCDIWAGRTLKPLSAQGLLS